MEPLDMRRLATLAAGDDLHVAVARRALHERDQVVTTAGSLSLQYVASWCQET
jgi:hypothetical protein